MDERAPAEAYHYVRVRETRERQYTVRANGVEHAEALVRADPAGGTLVGEPVVEVYVNPTPFEHILEPETAAETTGEGLVVKRGWFYEVNLDSRSACLEPAAVERVDDTGALIAPQRSDFVGLDEGNETVYSFVKAFGWAARPAHVSTWSQLKPTRAAALKSARRFAHALRTRANAREERLAEDRHLEEVEHAAFVALVRMQQGSGELERVFGGGWTTPQTPRTGAWAGKPPKGAPPGLPPIWTTTKEVADLLVEDGWACVFLRHATGNPTRLALTERGRAYAPSAALVQEAVACG